MKVVNESRNRNAGIEILISVAFDTPSTKYDVSEMSKSSKILL